MCKTTFNPTQPTSQAIYELRVAFRDKWPRAEDLCFHVHDQVDQGLFAMGLHAADHPSRAYMTDEYRTALKKLRCCGTRMWVRKAAMWGEPREPLVMLDGLKAIYSFNGTEMVRGAVVMTAFMLPFPTTPEVVCAAIIDRHQSGEVARHGRTWVVGWEPASNTHIRYSEGLGWEQGFSLATHEEEGWFRSCLKIARTYARDDETRQALTTLVGTEGLSKQEVGALVGFPMSVFQIDWKEVSLQPETWRPEIGEEI